MAFRPGPGKTKPRFTGKVVCVVWEDASWCSDQLPLAQVEEGFVVATYGLCVRETKKGLTVAMDLPRGLDQVRHTSFVPWAMVVDVQVYGTEYQVGKV